MDSNTIFSLANSLALACWILLIIAPFWKFTSKIIFSIAILLLALLYTVIIFFTFDPDSFASFNSLDGLKSLFTDENAILAGWVHYLAFDLMAGLYIASNAKHHNISRWWLIPCFLFTFMLGPFGLLLYVLVRTIRTKRLFFYEI